MSSKLNILGISGSLKSSSSNTAVLKAIEKLFNTEIELTIFKGLDEFPHFTPDNEAGNEAVKRFKQAIAKANGVIICSPEYAFGVPGSLKNALDWTVHSGDLNTKPTLAITCSPLYDGGKRCMTALLPTLAALGTIITEPEGLCIGDIYKKLNSDFVFTDTPTLNQVIDAIGNLIKTIHQA